MMTNDATVLRAWTETRIDIEAFTPVAPGWVASFDDGLRPVVGWLAQKVITTEAREIARPALTIAQWHGLFDGDPPCELKERRATVSHAETIVRRIVAAVALRDGEVIPAQDLPGLRGIRGPEHLPSATPTHDPAPSFGTANEEVF